MLEPLEMSLGCFSCPHVQITHSFCLPLFLLDFFFFNLGKFLANSSYRPLFTSLPPKRSAGTSQAWLVPALVRGMSVTFTSSASALGCPGRLRRVGVRGLPTCQYLVIQPHGIWVLHSPTPWALLFPSQIQEGGFPETCSYGTLSKFF